MNNDSNAYGRFSFFSLVKFYLSLSLMAAFGCSPLASTTGTVATSGVLTISPSVITVIPGSASTFTVTGGTPPYAFYRVVGSGTIIAATGLYTAPSTAGTDSIEVVDSNYQVAYATVTISGSTSTSGLSISPSTITLSPGTSYTFSATGGTGSYNFYRVSGNGSIIQSSGLFTAPAYAETDQIEVIDTANNIAYATITVSTSGSTSGVSISPSTLSLGASGSYTFVASGGTSPYYFYSVSGSGSINQTSGYYVAPSFSETDQVEVLDSAGHIAYATITVAGSSSTSTGTQIEVYRLYNSSNRDDLYSTSSSEGASNGFQYQGAAFQMFSDSSVASTTALYRCRTTNNPQRHFLSISSSCEGKIYESVFGYIYSYFVSGAVPLYRFVSSDGVTHLVTTNYNDGAAAGLQYEMILGYGFNP